MIVNSEYRPNYGGKWDKLEWITRIGYSSLYSEYPPPSTPRSVPTSYLTLITDGGADGAAARGC